MENGSQVWMDPYNRIYKLIGGTPYCWNWRLGWQRAAMYSTKDDLFAVELREIDPAMHGCGA